MFTLSSPLPLIRIYSGCPRTVALVTTVELPNATSLGFLRVRRNSFRVQVPPEGGDILLIVSLLYNSNNVNNNNNTISTGTYITKSNPLITGIYKSVLTVQ